MEAEVGPMCFKDEGRDHVKEFRGPLEAGSVKVMDSYLKFPKRTQPCGDHNFSQVRTISDL